MPTDQAITKEGISVSDSHDISVQIHEEQSEPSSPKHGTSSDGITDTKPDSERLDTHQEVDLSKEPTDTDENEDKRNIIVPPLNLGLPESSNSHPADPEGASFVPDSKPQSDGNADKEKDEISTHPSTGQPEQPEDTNQDQVVAGKDTTTAQSEVTSVVNTNSDEKDMTGTTETNPVTQAGQSSRVTAPTGTNGDEKDMTGTTETNPVTQAGQSSRVTAPTGTNGDEKDMTGTTETNPVTQAGQSSRVTAPTGTNGDEKDMTGTTETNPVTQAGQSSRVTAPTGTKPRVSSAGGNGSMTARTQQKDTNQSTPGSKTRTPRGITGTITKQNKQTNSKDSDQKFTKRPPSAASRSQRASESRVSSFIDRNKKQIEKTIVKKKSQANLSIPLSKPGPVESKPVDKSGAKQNTTETTNQTQNAGSQDAGKSKIPQQPKSTESTAKQSTQTKPANGIIHSGDGSGKDKASKEKENNEKEMSEQQRKAHVLLTRAVMKRVASLETKPNQASSRSNNVDLNSSTGSKSLEGKSSSPAPSHPRPTDKTQSMQSLAVPAPAIGPVPLEADERSSIGSRRDSVRLSVDSTSRKSVDYRLQTSHVVVPIGGGEDRPKSVMMHDDSMIRTAIPILSVRLAVVCLVLNIFLPGMGTMVSGFSVLCCAKSRLSNKGDTKATTVCINLFVGASQLATVTFLLVGWFWSLAWGVKMVILAVEHRTELRQQREKELQTLALRAFGSPANLRRSLLPSV